MVQLTKPHSVPENKPIKSASKCLVGGGLRVHVYMCVEEGWTLRGGTLGAPHVHCHKQRHFPTKFENIKRITSHIFVGHFFLSLWLSCQM